MREAIRGASPQLRPLPSLQFPKSRGGFCLRTNGGRCLGWKWNGVSYLLLLLSLFWTLPSPLHGKGGFFMSHSGPLRSPEKPIPFLSSRSRFKNGEGGGRRGGGGMAMLPDIDIKVTAAAADCRQTFLGSV